MQRMTLLAVLCLIQAIVAAVTAVAVFVEVESIIGFGPVIALLGLVIGRCSIQSQSVNLLLFGLLCPIATAVLALLIGGFDWSPSEAELPARIILTINAVVMLAWGTYSSSQLVQRRSQVASTERTPFRFSLLGLLGVITATCVVFAVWRHLVGRGEGAWFAAYGIAVGVVSAALAAWFSTSRAASSAKQKEAAAVCGPGQVDQR